uniref:NADH dehydrogenase [ubiquinone] 1 beta subcomplex subunit 7 n=2 Tax=Anabas testudineus TaxID=64144 RepID=A0A3Q1I148_ANATE
MRVGGGVSPMNRSAVYFRWEAEVDTGLVECEIIVGVMGAHLARRYITERDTEPDPTGKKEFDPHFGFAERKEREMVASQEQMNLAQLPLQQRDYCAHYLLKFMKCKRDNWPNFMACKHERHDWDYCEHQDYVMRMKEYERERRLQLRKKRIEAQAQAA